MLYLILFNYTAPFEALDRALPAHCTHFDARRTNGHFLTSGPFLSREGGGTLARAEFREEISTTVAHDPPVIENPAQARVIAWDPNRHNADVPQVWLSDTVVAASA